MGKVNIKKVAKDLLDRRSTYEYRKQCVRQLVSTGDLKVLEYFFKIIKNMSEKSDIRAYCITMLDPDNGKNQDLLFGLLINKNEHETVRNECIKKLIKGKAEDTLRMTKQLLIDRLGDKTDDPNVLFWVAWGLGELKSPDGIQPLLEVLYDKTQDLQVRRSSVTALANIDSSERTQKIVLSILVDYNENPWARRNSVRILRRVADRSTIPILMKVLEGEESDRMKEMLRSLIEELQNK